MIIYELAEFLTSLAFLALIVTQVIVPAIFPTSPFGPKFFWLFRRKSKAREADQLRQELVETAQERQLRQLRERLKREQEAPVVEDPPVTEKNPKPPKTDQPPPKDDGDGQSSVAV